MCVFFLVDTTTHHWQAENTLFFPTLIVREDMKRMEVMCVCGSGVHLTYEESEERGGFHDTLEG